MIRLRQGTPGKVYTVSWVKGGGRIARPLEERGVVAGVDVTLLSLTPEGGALVRLRDREFSLTPAEAENLVVDAPLVRKKGDPVFLGGCCGYGNTSAMWENTSTETRRPRTDRVKKPPPRKRRGLLPFMRSELREAEAVASASILRPCLHIGQSRKEFDW